MHSLLNLSARGLMQWFGSSVERWPTVNELATLLSEIFWFQKYLDDRRAREIFIAELIEQNEYKRFLLQLENHKRSAKIISRKLKSKRKENIMTDLLTSPEMLFPIVALWVVCQQVIQWRSAAPSPDPLPAFTLRGAAAIPVEQLVTDEEGMDWLYKDQERRADAFARHWGGPEYPKALWSVIKGAGVPRSQIGGRSPWAIIEDRDPDVAEYLRSLGDDRSHWNEIRREVEKVRGQINGQIFCVGASAKKLEDEAEGLRRQAAALKKEYVTAVKEERPDEADALAAQATIKTDDAKAKMAEAKTAHKEERALNNKIGWISTGPGAAGYCAERVWKQRGQELAAAEEAPAPTLEPTPEPENENERVAP
ncbi:hypothetical protein T8K17_05100 [Thalassobaculum sp. OXR-137]|uniref:hypothetical protein n=1 Tax=Thalassobaculum sp. OXR-137 TaxID=3100173 RepID=UPI002AC8C7F7|nr:hypothetical protein [Thalassobaculum sp. OXR-137]WPZ35523.1 hypothetical protein T8K17_05100 [Thalassobaculum sp. OXR-137]